MTTKCIANGAIIEDAAIAEVLQIEIFNFYNMKWKCTKCGQIVTSPPLNNQCPKEEITRGLMQN